MELGREEARPPHFDFLSRDDVHHGYHCELEEEDGAPTQVAVAEAAHSWPAICGKVVFVCLIAWVVLMRRVGRHIKACRLARVLEHVSFSGGEE